MVGAVEGGNGSLYTLMINLIISHLSVHLFFNPFFDDRLPTQKKKKSPDQTIQPKAEPKISLPRSLSSLTHSLVVPHYLYLSKIKESCGTNRYPIPRAPNIIYLPST